MKKIIGFALVAMIFTACSDAGDKRPEEMPTVTQQPPSSDPNVHPDKQGPLDKSTTGVQDSSTVIDYDTAARKKQ